MARDNKIITVSAPGKIHFLGEHVVVYGKPALLAAIDKRCTVSLSPRRDKKIEVISKNFNKSLTVSPLAVLEGTKLAERNWEEFIKTGNVKLLSSLTKDLLSYPIIAIGETLNYYSSSEERSDESRSLKGASSRQARTINLKQGFTLTIDSDIPVGAGLGSSAAIAVTIAAAVTLFLGKPFDKQKIYDISYRAEQKKHGRPSGGDPATVLHGGLVWFRRETNDLKIIQSVPFLTPTNIAQNFYLIDTGKPKESTGEMVARVKSLHDKKPNLVHELFDSQENLTRQLLSAIKKADETLIIRIIRVGEINLERLGVVSPFVKKLIREIEKSGGAAKISGGGGVKKGTGMLLVYHKNRKSLESVLKLHQLPFSQTQLGVGGLRIEKSDD